MWQVVCLDQHIIPYHKNPVTILADSVCAEHCTQETAEKHAVKNSKIFKPARYVAKLVQS